MLWNSPQPGGGLLFVYINIGEWEKCQPPILFFLHDTIEGKRLWMGGATYRRRAKNGRWEYRQDEETEQDWLDRAW
jgi:hypothetical protein